MAVDVLLVPLIVTAACLLPIGALARPLAVCSGLIVAGRAAAALWLGLGGGPSEALVWAGPLGATFSLGSDGFSAVLLVLTGVLFAAGAAASGGVAAPRAFVALWSLLQLAASGVLLARDLILFFAFWEAMLVPLALLLWLWGGPDRRAATYRFLLYTMAGSALLLVGIVVLGGGAHTFALAGLVGYRLAEPSQVVLALLFLGAFAVKLPLFPFHGWLPRAYASAPVPVAIVLSGVIAKTAVYGIARICLPLFPLGMADLAPLLAALATVGALYGAILAGRQDDTRGLIAYSSLSHLNLIGLAAVVGSGDALRAALVASVSHGLVVAALFLLTGALAARTGSTAYGSGGLAARAPVLATFTTIAVIAAIGVPGTSGFAGEVLILSATYARFPGAALLATTVVIGAAVYGLGFLRRAFFGPAAARGSDLGWRERALVLPLLALVLAVGVAPRVISDVPLGPPAERAQ
jgi:NADH-quinone oxidoreductase subunit M